MPVLFFILLWLAIILPTESQAACNALVNGRPMTPQECSIALQVYGRVVPGRYAADAYGNWVNLDNPAHRGNTYRDAERSSNNSGNSGGSKWFSPRDWDWDPPNVRRRNW
jgi:hypothetical protein